ncbi:S1 domain-containing RNA-binding protein [Tuberibacillus sp. Marseille-P3662]|uniref:S1 domain-containing RNA-binding protein n=1 Tax=Tuberibacillus sp. Marseille-P3662 TaxID=1965358 RepID=UPI000A1C80CD|nr:S1 domain-containing RNA-binding protein [Tuberibacillus sp. Marseille-P3662]
MTIEAGNKLEGKVSGITRFGAFVDLPGGKTGLVHISEVADRYVKDINDVLSVGDQVTVKVLKVEDDGKIGLSIRKAVDRPKSKRGGGPPRQKKQSFEDKMNRFLKDSEERQSALRRQDDSKRNNRGARKS